MADLQGSTSTTALPIPAVNKSIHAHRVAGIIPNAIKQASNVMLGSMLNLNPGMPDWYMNTREVNRQQLKALIDERWRVQGELDEVLDNLQHEIEVFAKPLLSNALKENFNIGENPDDLSLQLYVPDNLVFGIDTGVSRIRRSSLLASALHNFEEAETLVGAFRSGSGVYKNDAQGGLLHVNEITPEKFASVCRKLDIGGQYQTYLKARLAPSNKTQRHAVQERSVASEKATFKLFSFIARMKGEVSARAYARLREVVEGQSGITLNGRPLHNHRLSLMGFRLTGVVLFSAVSEPSTVKKAIDALTPDHLMFWTDWSRHIPVLPGDGYEQFKLLQAFFANGPEGVKDEWLRDEDIYQQSRLSGPLIAYIPDDPDHPLREYDSLADFMKTLIGQLRDPQYQAFFSRFVAQKDKGRFFARVNERLKTISWQQRDPLDMGPWWRETAIENPNAEPITNVIDGDLWITLFRERRDKALADARQIAVPTDDEDAATRWKRLASYLDIGWNVFSFAAMLVPGLGEAVLGVMVAQMLAGLAEGIEDWSKGDREEAGAHINGVLINFAQLALMGAGHVLPTGAVKPVKVSPFVENLKPVQFKGKERLWSPDLTPYRHPLTLPEESRANGLGLHLHEDQQVLRLDDQHYVVRQDAETGRYRLQHPTRPGAYQPVLEHNGAGSWRTELDQPLEWDKLRLLRRLGPEAQAWSDESLEQVLTVSGVQENALRRLHVEHQLPPAMLVDTFKRYKLWADTGDVGRFEALYRQGNVSADSRANWLVSEYPQLPASVAEELVLKADPVDLRHLAEKQSLPLRLREQARMAQARVRLSRAYEGLYLERLANNDTRRLELASLANLPGWSENMRIEIRGYSFSGELYASVGPDDAPVRKVLVCDENGRYEARDEQDQHLHGADDFYASVLHALPDSEREALGYDIYEGGRLKQAIRSSPLSHEHFESVLAEHPIRKPAYDPQTMRLRGGMEGYRQLGDRSMLQTRLGSLYPAFTEEQVGTMLADFGELADQRVSALEDEFNELNYKFRVWMDSLPFAHRLSPAGMAELRSRELFYRAVRQCWQRTGPDGEVVPGIVRPQMLKLDGVPMNHLANMPRLGANFDHVTSLSLRNCNLLNTHEAFIKPFRRLRVLDLGHNQLNRLPPIIGNLRQLEHLILNDNRIELTHAAVDCLKGLIWLKSLGLRANPLGLLPDISRMPKLQVLILESTGIDSWPTGLFAQARPRNIYLDMRNNPISRIPDVAPGSFRAELLARTLLSREPQWLSPENLEKLKFYTESMGLDPERPYPPRGTVDSSAWAEGMTEQQWQAWQPIWNDVEDEFNSEAFFDEIRRLTQSADFKAGGSYRLELTARVWRMLEAMSEDSELRTTIFAEAVARTQCVDGATQLFNVLGMKVLVHEAYGLANPGLIEAELVSLAKGKSRLDEIERIAEHHIAERVANGEQIRRVGADGDVTGTIDVVEVHLAFTTELAKPQAQNGLDLPWQARSMQFRGIAGVTPPMIEAARLRVLALEEGDLLRDSIAEQPFWNSWVEDTHRASFESFDRRMNTLYEFKSALDERAADADLSPEERDRLTAQIKTLAHELGKSESEYVPGRVMTDDEFTEQYSVIKSERDDLLKQLTQQAMDRAKVQRVEVPFTVEA
nr:DUF6543 domain-containing protein [Pseudomonas izuensis]